MTQPEDGTMPYPPEEDPETFTGDEVDDTWLDSEDPQEQEADHV